MRSSHVDTNISCRCWTHGLMSYKSVFDQESGESVLTSLKFQSHACPCMSTSKSERAIPRSTCHGLGWEPIHLPGTRPHQGVCEFHNNKGQVSSRSHLLFVLSVLVTLGTSYLTFLFRMRTVRCCWHSDTLWNKTEQSIWLELPSTHCASGKEPTCQGGRREMWLWSLAEEDPPEEGLATHSSILAWRIPMDRGAWWAIVHRVPKNLTQLKQLHTHTHTHTHTRTSSTVFCAQSCPTLCSPEDCSLPGSSAHEIFQARILE